MARKRTVAVIGAGPGGLVSAHEFLSTLDSTGAPAFEKVVVFEQKDRVGGVWAWDETPDKLNHGDLSGEYWDRHVIHPTIDPPSSLQGTSLETPVVAPAANNGNQWTRSGVYPDLYTNVAKRFMRFSSVPFEAPSEPTSITPLITHKEVLSVLEQFSKDHHLEDVIRLRSQVHAVEKHEDKWTLTVRQADGDEDKWYQEEFDAVAVATGHYATPYIPQIEGLDTRKPGSVSHSKSYRDPSEFKDKTVLIVGSSLSGIDIVQYLDGVSNVVISRTPGKQEIYPWLEKAALQSQNKPRIQRVDGDVVTFVDGSQLNVDHILFATGYHWHWPFIGDKFLEVSKVGGSTSTSGSRVKGLFYNVFNIEDDSLGFVGVTLSSIKFHSLEAAAAALAGVWSGQRSLPSKEEQKKWELKRLEETADNVLFHYYVYDVVKQEWFDPVIESFAVPGRPNPLEGEDIEDMDRATESAERVYYEIKSQVL